ncbi:MULTISPECIES: ribonuclease P protein component [Kitasatospora]|uniref:Ribonuclease P protein component n=1 Tax=Kitasatospora setae (strain ATCC 33774 / DSM 43861 / JCM 3304 / KCC A-0304 / NBRC 14216 / KM-6054) TaxID=452652 RepID=E4MZD9_KITSK|nr:ribonuclease P protein component [Kitasatospora setae]BAJ29713.1 putative ribonuclease P protein component [Kitasatospora setae KM-6054]
MLPTENRLRRRQDFAAAVKRGRRAGRPLLVVHLQREAVPEAGSDRNSDSRPHVAEGLPPARAGFVVSKAVGPAVVRNAVKRRLRHLVGERLSRLPAGSLIVVRALPAAATAPYPDLAHDLDAALRRVLRSEPAGGAPTGTGR